MAEKRIFVGREDELEQFRKVLEDPQGQAILVVGQAGMGKTWLVNKMAEVAENHPDLKCGWVRYEVTPTDGVDSTMALMMDNAFEAAEVAEGSFNGTPRSLQQWKALLNVIKIGDLVMTLRREPQCNTRDQFLKRLELISKRMPENGRAIFIIDPEKYMQEKSDQSWAIVIKSLPERIKFVFPQRPEDELLKSNVFKGLANVVYIPEGKLDVLEEENVEDLVRLRADNVGKSAGVLRETVKRYEGHPYAIQAALDIVERTKSLEGLPQDPTPQGIAKAQWEGICECSNDAIKLFEAYAILEVGVPDEVVEKVSGLNSTTRKRLQKDKYLRGLLREEGEGRRIYHAILVDYILGQIGEAETKEYHGRAVRVYREKLAEAEKKQTKPDALAATRLAEHVLAAEGEQAFVVEFIRYCWPALLKLGLFDVGFDLCKKSLSVLFKRSASRAMVTCIMGEIYRFRGDLNKAEDSYLRSLDISVELGFFEGIANSYGNLGLTYRMRGDMEKAETMHLKSLKIEKKLGRLSGIATDYGNLGLVYSALGELEKAEKMHNQSLGLAKRLGQLGEVANQYNNLGLIYEKQGDIQKALKVQLKSLNIEERIGRSDGIANSYGNIGLLYVRQGKFAEAEDYMNKALKLYQGIGDPEGVARQYSNLATIYIVRGRLDRAEELCKAALTMNKKYGFGEGTGANYSTLGTIYLERGDLEKAREYWEKAVDLYKKIGMKLEAEKVQSWLDGLSEK